MKSLSRYILVVCLFAGCVSKDSKPDTSVHEEVLTTAARPPVGFKSGVSNVNGINIHYVTGGKGEPLLLIHGFGQNWFMWNRLLPELSKHFTIIAPDLRGVGESDKPESGYEKKDNGLRST